MLTAGRGLVHVKGGCAARVGAQSMEIGTATTAGDGGLEDARVYATWARLERQFVLGAAAGRGRLLMPRHSRERFEQLVRWMARDAGRRAQLPTVLRATGLYMERTQLVDFGAEAEVNALVARLTRGTARREG